MPRHNDRLYEEKLGQREFAQLVKETMQTSHRMEVWFAELHREEFSYLRNGIIPVLIVSNDLYTARSANITVLPLTTREKRLDLATHIRLTSQNNPCLDRDLTVLAEQITTISKSSLRRKIGEVTCTEDIEKVEMSILALIGLEVEEV